MSWNGNDNKDPWGRNDTPPEIDEVIKKVRQRIESIFGGGSSGDSSGGGGFSLKSLPLILGVLVLLWVGAGIYQVEQAERSVVLRLGKFEEIKGPGLRWNPPIIDAWEIVDVVRVRPHRHDALMLTKDENIVDVTVSIQYQIADPQKYVLDIRDADASLVQATESALRHVVGGSIMDDALTTGREVIAQDVKTRLQRYLNKYNTGLEVVIVNIETLHHQIKCKKPLMMLLRQEKTKLELEMKPKLMPMAWYQKPEDKLRGCYKMLRLIKSKLYPKLKVMQLVLIFFYRNIKRPQM